MAREQVKAEDRNVASAGYGREDAEVVEARTNVHWVLRGPDGEIKQEGRTHNLITDVGDQWAIESAHGIGTPNALTGMRLGTGGSTAAAKNGAGAAIVTYVTGSNQAFDTGPTGSDNGAGAGYDVDYSVTWAAGEATANGIDECVITNETPLTNVQGSAANTIARFVLSPTVNKAAGDTLTVTWTHRHNGA